MDMHDKSRNYIAQRIDRKVLGRMVRQIRVDLMQVRGDQCTCYDALPEDYQDVECQIGEKLAAFGLTLAFTDPRLPCETTKPSSVDSAATTKVSFGATVIRGLARCFSALSRRRARPAPSR